MGNIRIPVNTLKDDQLLTLKLEQDFDSLEVLSLTISSSEAYSKMSSDFGVVVGRCETSGGFGTDNCKISIFVPIKPEDVDRPEIFEIYPFKTTSDTFPNGVRYNLLPRIRNGRNTSHRAVGNFPDLTDLTNYPSYLEVFETYYKYTTTTNDAGDYMIFGVPLGSQKIVMDFDVFDTRSFEVTANDLVELTSIKPSVKEIETYLVNLRADLNLKAEPEIIKSNTVPGFIYRGDGNYDIELKTNLDEMPNIFHEIKQINVSPFWGDKEIYDIGITRCDFKINFKFKPSAIFFGHLSSMTNSFMIKSDYTTSAANPEIYAKDDVLGYETGDIYPLQSYDIVVYRLDDANNIGSRKLIGIYKSYVGTGYFRLTLPMYMNYYTTNEYGDLIPSLDPNIGIPTQGNYAFEMYETNESFRGTRNVWGGYSNSIIPGIRIPATAAGDKWLGGWDGTTGGKFEYDLFNKKRKFYTLSTTYRKFDKSNVLLDGSSVSYFPQISPNKKGHYWNFPIDYRDTPYLDEVTVYGGVLIPRVEFKTNITTKLSEYPSSLLVIPFKNAKDTYDIQVEDWEWFLGIGTQLDGLNNGDTFNSLYKGTDYMIQNAKGEKKSIYGIIPTFNWGDNTKSVPFNPSLYAIDLASKAKSNANINKVQKAYTQTISDYVTTGVFVNSSDYQVGKIKLFEVALYDITDSIQDLIVNGVYSSYQKTSGPEGVPGDGTYHLNNAYKGKYYSFGFWKGINSLYDIESNYFKVIV